MVLVMISIYSMSILCTYFQELFVTSGLHLVKFPSHYTSVNTRVAKVAMVVLYLVKLIYCT